MNGKKYVIVDLAKAESFEKAAELDKLAFRHGASYVIGVSATGLKTWPPAGETLARVQYRPDQLEPHLIELRDKADWIILEPEDPKDWRIIPYENAITLLGGHKAKLAVPIYKKDDVTTVFHIFEKGADAAVVDRPDLIAPMCQQLKPAPILDLVWVKVTEVDATGKMGSRVCVDSIDRFLPGEGLLAGAIPGFMIGVHAEIDTKKYVNERRFRVNLSVESTYSLGYKDGRSPKPLADFQCNDIIYPINFEEGQMRESWVNKVKIERRPMVLVKAKAEVSGKMYAGHTWVQKAETVQLPTKDRGLVDAEHLQVDVDYVRALVSQKTIATHFGMTTDEECIER